MFRCQLTKVAPGLRRAGIAAVACGGWFAFQSMAVREHLGLGASLVARCNPHLRHTSIKGPIRHSLMPRWGYSMPFQNPQPELVSSQRHSSSRWTAAWPPSAPTSSPLPLSAVSRTHSTPGLSAPSDVLPDVARQLFPRNATEGGTGQNPRLALGLLGHRAAGSLSRGNLVVSVHGAFLETEARTHLIRASA